MVQKYKHGKPRYLSKQRQTNGTYLWFFNPPVEAVRDGVSKALRFKDYYKARTYAIAENIKIDEWREGVSVVEELKGSHNLLQAVASYMSTSHFRSLSENTQKSYKKAFKKICSTQYKGKDFGRTTIIKVSPAMCQSVYEKWLEEGTANAAHLTRIFSVLMSYCMSFDLILRNPMKRIKKVVHEPESTTWTKEQVQKFLEVAFEDFRTRNIGLLVYMAYCWCQRPVDIRNLRWSDIDFTEKSVTIVQSKRGAEVRLPIHDKLYALLKKQKDDFCFQEYVCPYLAQDRVWKPMSAGYMQDRVNEVLMKAELPENLSAGRLRTTGIQELVESDVDVTAIMSVTGHKSLTSLSPYVRPKLSAARMALDKRGEL